MISSGDIVFAHFFYVSAQNLENIRYQAKHNRKVRSQLNACYRFKNILKKKNDFISTNALFAGFSPLRHKTC